MTTASIRLQDLQRRIYAKAKAEPSWRFWGLYVHVCKLETLRDGVRSGKGEQWGAGHRRRHVRGHRGERRRGVSPTAPGRTGLPHVSAPAVSEAGDPEGGPQGQHPLDPCHPRPRGPGRAQAASWSPSSRPTSNRGRLGTARRSPRIKRWTGWPKPSCRARPASIDLDLRAYFDSVRHDLLLAKVARRINDPDVLALLKQMLKASGKTGVPQGGVISPLLSNLYLTEVDRMLETGQGGHPIRPVHGSGVRAVCR